MYLIILTAKNNEADIVSGLRAGADDYITKPPIAAELQARVRVGERILALQETVKEQSILANQASGREHLLRKSHAASLPTRSSNGEEAKPEAEPPRQLREHGKSRLDFRAEARNSVPDPEPLRRVSETVLVAEDDPIFRQVLESRLESWGYRVITAEDGTQAWELLQQPNSLELLILDWMMPGIDGIELCRRIREKQHGRYQYILLLSGKDQKQDVVDGLEAGADDYLTKPFDIRELRARLRAGKRILTLQHQLIPTR
jgi:DNA-binding response OmpR family regulator